jgi:hypothetical protein
MTREIIVKTSEADLSQKQEKEPILQGFLLNDWQRRPVNIDVHRHSIFQTSNSRRKSRSA